MIYDFASMIYYIVHDTYIDVFAFDIFKIS